MLYTVKSLLHKLFGLYIIAGFTTVSLFGNISNVFAQQQSAGGGSDVGGFGLNEGNTEGITGIAGTGTDGGEGLLGIVKTFINWALSLVGLIAFAMLVWGGYKMVASGGDEKAYEEGLKILKNAAIGIAFIAISWTLVTFIFFVVNKVTA